MNQVVTHAAHSTSRSGSAHIKLSLAALAIMGALTHMPLRAAEAESDAERKKADDVEVVEVTGSRIRRTDLEGTTPVVSLSAEDIRASGALNITDVLNKLPSMVPSLSDQTTNYNGYAGMSTQDLRGLGAERTLILVNGRRHVASIPGTSIVDTSTIPLPLIKRVDILTGGASSIYGADAISGVINIILRDDFEGTDLSVYYGVSGEGDGARQSLDLTHGQNLASGGGNLVFNLSAYKSDPVLATDRDYVNSNIAYVPNPADPDGNIAGVPNRIVGKRQPFWNMRQRNFLINGVPHVLNADGSSRATTLGPGGVIGDADAGFYGIYTDGGEYFGDYEFQRLSVPYEKLNLNVNYNQDLGSNLALSSELKYVRSQAESRTGPYGTYGGNNLPANYAFYTPHQLQEVQRRSADPSTAWNPGLEFAGYFPELGEGGLDYDTELYQFNVALRGEFGNGFDWDAYVQHGRSNSDDTAYGDFNQAHWDAGVAGATLVNGNPSCGAGCVPINVFQPLTTAMLDYLRIAPHTSNSDLRQWIAAATVRGDLWDLPAGPMAFAAGVEWRKEQSTRTPSDVRQSGIGVGYTVEKPIVGDYSVKEVFAELRVPVLENMFLAESLSIDTAIRHADYSTAGSNASWSYGFNWQPVADLKWRASYAKAVRAPNITEVFATESYGGSWVNDPCSAWFYNANPNRARNCASLGITPAQVPYWTWATTNNSGNPDLDVETAYTLTTGFVYAPRQIQNFSLLVDYWDVELEDQIDSFYASTIINGCVDSASLDNLFCEYVTRDPQGKLITQVELTQLNLAKHQVRGVDAQINYHYTLPGDLGRLSFNSIWSRLIERKLQAHEKSELTDTVGGLAFPELRGRTSLGWQRNSLAVTLTGRYIGAQAVNPAATEESAYPLRTASLWYFDANVGYSLSAKTSLNFTVNNLADKGTPQVPGAHVGGASWHLGYTAGLFDTVGRYWSLGVAHKF